MLYRLLGILIIVLAWGAAAPAMADTERWVLVDTDKTRVKVLQGDEVLAEFPGISYGRDGARPDRLSGERITPLGEFRVGWTKDESRFHRFIGVDYPSREHARRALDADIIDLDTYLDIRVALARNQVPPQDTALGGHIGIHGLGDHNPHIHAAYNWTRGCVALTDEQMDKLAEFVELGMRVVIR